jgi:hypothetical protein
MLSGTVIPEKFGFSASSPRRVSGPANLPQAPYYVHFDSAVPMQLAASRIIKTVVAGCLALLSREQNANGISPRRHKVVSQGIAVSPSSALWVRKNV